MNMEKNLMPSMHVDVEYNVDTFGSLVKDTLLYFETNSDCNWLFKISKCKNIKSDDLMDIFPDWVDKKGREKSSHLYSKLQQQPNLSLKDYFLLDKVTSISKNKDINLYYGGFLTELPLINGYFLSVCERNNNYSESMIHIFLGKVDLGIITTQLESMYSLYKMGLLPENKPSSEYMQWNSGDYLLTGWQDAVE